MKRPIRTKSAAVSAWIGDTCGCLYIALRAGYGINWQSRAGNARIPTCDITSGVRLKVGGSSRGLLLSAKLRIPSSEYIIQFVVQHLVRVCRFMPILAALRLRKRYFFCTVGCVLPHARVIHENALKVPALARPIRSPVYPAVQIDQTTFPPG